MGHVYPVGSGDPVDIVAWWAEQAIVRVDDEDTDDEAE